MRQEIRTKIWKRKALPSGKASFQKHTEDWSLISNLFVFFDHFQLKNNITLYLHTSLIASCKVSDRFEQVSFHTQPVATLISNSFIRLSNFAY